LRSTPFNVAQGPDFGRSVTFAALGQAMTLSDPFSQAAAETLNPGWVFAPDAVSVVRGTPVSMVNRGGEPQHLHRSPEVRSGFIPGLNDGQDTVPECANGFDDPKVPITRGLQGQLQIAGLSREPISSGAASIRGCARKSS
jgi:hypothetical protein